MTLAEELLDEAIWLFARAVEAENWDYAERAATMAFALAQYEQSELPR